MRIVALGLGGAGCRIVDSLYAIDRKSSRVACVEGLVADVDEATLRRLRGKCVSDVKKSVGAVTFEDVARFQKGE